MGMGINTATFSYTHTHTAHTHIHTQQSKKVKSLAAAKQSRRPSETLRYLGTTQALKASACKSTWARASAPQVGLHHAQGDGVGT